MKLKKGDKVIVISGKEKGKTGVIQKVMPKENKVIIDGLNVRKKNQKPTQANPKGGQIDIYAPIHASNVAFYDEKAKKAVKIGYKFDKDLENKDAMNYIDVLVDGTSVDGICHLLQNIRRDNRHNHRADK